MNSLINMRKGNEGDLHKVSKLWLLMLNEMSPECNTPRPDWWRGIAATNMRNGYYFVFVAEKGNSIVGFVDYFLFPEPSTGKIHAVGQHFYVKPEYRGTKIAWRLYDTINKDIKEHKAEIIELFCFDKEQKMWEKKGYKHKRNLMRKVI